MAGRFQRRLRSVKPVFRAAHYSGRGSSSGIINRFSMQNYCVDVTWYQNQLRRAAPGKKSIKSPKQLRFSYTNDEIDSWKTNL
jgi:hypothetical protein